MPTYDTKGILQTAPGGGQGGKVYDTQGRLLVKQIETGVAALIIEPGFTDDTVAVFTESLPAIALAFTDDTVAVFSQVLPSITYEFT